ncbi:hypothetical protein M408DRAFT_31111 [Serendipita vermifera MAFF 305830]|nr:hypothetical protein M408DRAFT_31111 [Serendipita vermifera MAFF 305830]
MYSIVEHCDCDPTRPNIFHRHVFEYSDLLDPPPEIHTPDLQTIREQFETELLHDALNVPHQQHSSLHRRRAETLDATDMSGDNDFSEDSDSSFEIQVRTTTPEAKMEYSPLPTFGRTRQDAGNSKEQVQTIPFWWDGRSGEF